MISWDRLMNEADRYRNQGYDVILRPGPEALPAFAKDFQVEILARRGDGGVLASVKQCLTELESDPALSRYAETVERHPDWRYDLIMLGSAREEAERARPEEASDEAIASTLDVADRLLDASFPAQALVSAWAATESAMRRRMRARGGRVGGSGSARSMLNELLSSGELSYSEFHELERLHRSRNLIVHGFSAPNVAPGDIAALARTARRLMKESTEVEAAP